MTDTENIHKALNQLMSACGLCGESGTERLFPVLSQAVEAVDVKWDSVVGQSHRNGLCYDVNGLLADEIASILKKKEKLIREAPEGWNPPF